MAQHSDLHVVHVVFVSPICNWVQQSFNDWLIKYGTKLIPDNIPPNIFSPFEIVKKGITPSNIV
jgi:hypothetical protein